MDEQTKTVPALPPRTAPMNHRLKCHPQHFRDATNPNPLERKLVELRIDDRGYQSGDTLTLEEWDPATEEYSGRWCAFLVTHLVRGGPWLTPGCVAMSIRPMAAKESAR